MLINQNRIKVAPVLDPLTGKPLKEFELGSVHEKLRDLTIGLSKAYRFRPYQDLRQESIGERSLLLAHMFIRDCRDLLAENGDIERL